MTFEELLTSPEHVAVLSLLPTRPPGVAAIDISKEMIAAMNLKITAGRVAKIVTEFRKVGLRIQRTMGTRFIWYWFARPDERRAVEGAYRLLFEAKASPAGHDANVVS